jgi:hypothetical protein
MPIGMLCLALAILWGNFPVFAGYLGSSWTHGLRGFLFGISIGLNLLSVRLIARQRQNQRPCGTI